jgi:hypothetical protein
MAVTIQQYASNLTMANSDLIWVVTSNSSSRAQYQFICALQDGCGNTLTTVKQQPNPSSKGVFDLGRIVKQYLDYDYDHFNGGADGLFQVNQNTAKFFKVAFGEEYGTSPSSSVVVYNGINNTTPAAPANTGSVKQYYFINGVLDPNYGSFSWNTSSYYIPEPTPSDNVFTYNVCMTDASRTQYARSTDFLTISAINGNILGIATGSAQDIAQIDIAVYNNTSSVYTDTIYNIAPSALDSYGGPRTNSSQLWSEVYTLNTCDSTVGQNRQTSGSLLITMPIGPANITAAGGVNLTTTPWTHYTITLLAQVEPLVDASPVWDQFTIYKTTGNCDYNGVRFAWVNDYGVWDYYTFGLQNDKTTAMDRGIYKQNFVNYSTTTNAVPYNISRRGNNAYYTNINEIYTANSDWLTQEEADWLEGLFYSPNVYIQDGFNMVPVIINSNDFVSKTNPRTQKNFQYAITYTLANSKRPR